MLDVIGGERIIDVLSLVHYEENTCFDDGWKG